MRSLAITIYSALALAAVCCDGGPPKVPPLPPGFDVCQTPLDGDEGPNGFDYLAQIDVGRTEAGGEDDDEGEPSPFDLDAPYGTETGYGWVGAAGEATVDPSWTTWAWPYGGRGDPRIHLATRAGMGGYRFDVPAGVYAVTWHFIEKAEHWSALREADLLVEGEVAVARYDVFEEVGNRFMVRARALAKVEDGRLDLGFVDKGYKSPPILSALEVEAIDPDVDPPADVTDLVARGGYGQAILTWEIGPERDLRGANVWRAAAAGGPWIRVNPRVVTARHFVDHGLAPGSVVFYKVVAQDLFCNDAPGAVTGPVVVRDHPSSSLPVFDIRLSASALAKLTEDVSSDDYVDATLLIDGQQLPIEIRNRGASTRYLSKQNFKIRIEDGLTFEGRNGFKLNAEVVDPLLVTEKLSYDLFGLSDAMAPRARYVHVVLDGRYLGVYTEVEEVDSLFFENRGLDPDGNLYRLGGGLLNVLESPAAYEETYEKKTNEGDPAGHADLIAFIEELGRTPEHELAAWWDARFSADEYADFLAVNAIVGNSDLIDGNQYLYHDTALDRWHHVPWDYNNGTFSNPWGSPLALTLYEAGPYDPWWFDSITRFYTNAELRARVLERLWELLDGELSADAVTAVAADAVGEASEDVLLDPWMVAWERDQSYVDEAVGAIAEFAEARQAFLLEAIGALTTLHGPLVINEYQALNTGQAVDDHGDADPWIELFNRGEETVWLAGTCIGPDLRGPDSLHCFDADLAVEPGQAILLWADGEPEEGPSHLGFILDGDGGELVLFAPPEGEEPSDEGAGQVLDVVFFGPQVPGESYGRTENGSEAWGPIISPTPGG